MAECSKETELLAEWWLVRGGLAVVTTADEISSELKLKSVWFAAKGVSGESVRRRGGGDLGR